MSYQILHGDSRELLKTLGDNSVDAIVCDPPYNLTSIQNRFGKAGAASAADGVYLRSSKGFMGKAWDSDVAFHPAVWIECLRVLKPGGHLVAFGGCRTYHRMVCAVEDAGFEVRDQLAWLFATGFPKSHNVSKSIDRRAGAEREVIGVSENSRDRDDDAISWDQGKPCLITVPSTEEAQQWDGFGSALKPGHEPVLLARKPLEGTIVENVLKWGTGALNIDATRIRPSPTSQQSRSSADDSRVCTCASRDKGEAQDISHKSQEGAYFQSHGSQTRLPPNEFEHGENSIEPQDSQGDCPICPHCGGVRVHYSEEGDRVFPPQRPDADRFPDLQTTYERNHDYQSTSVHNTTLNVQSQPKLGRWPANVCHDGSPEVLAGFPQTGNGSGVARTARPGQQPFNTERGWNQHSMTREGATAPEDYGDAGSAARFFFSAKATRSERNGSRHPTVKPIRLIEWLIKLVTPPGGTVLDPFAGSGTTGEAAVLNGFNVIMIEMEAQYVQDIRNRMAEPKVWSIDPDAPQPKRPKGFF